MEHAVCQQVQAPSESCRQRARPLRRICWSAEQFLPGKFTVEHHMVLCEVVDRLAVHIADAGSAACQTLQHALVAGMDLLGRNTKLGRKVAAVWPSLPGSLPGLPCGCTRCAASLLFLATSESLASLVATVLAGVATELAVASSDLAPFLLRRRCAGVACFWLCSFK